MSVLESNMFISVNHSGVKRDSNVLGDLAKNMAQILMVP